MKLLDERVTHTRDDYYLTRLADMEVQGITRTLRTSIRRNAYDFQSTAKVELWTDAGWTEVVHATPSGDGFLGIPSVATDKVALTRALATAADEMERRARLVLG